MSSRKHIPQRTCVACRQVKAKRELIRLVRIAEGRVEVDSSGKEAGRGTYLCPTPECWEVGLKSSRIEYALRATLIPENREQLIKHGKTFYKESISGQSK
ncbi:MAG: hypothetical protein CL875_06030 [Dehalococcoidales bacterium]|nr:hypothetical protein [Dehalococcoidales bacterium]